MPGYVFEHIALVDLHRVRHLTACWFSRRGSEIVDDPSSQLDVPSGEGLREWLGKVVIRPVSFAAHILQTVTSDL